MADINWGILSGWRDPGQSLLQGFEAGRRLGQERRRESALAAYTESPSQEALLGVLQSGDVSAYAQLSKVEADRAERERVAGARRTGGNVLRNVLGGTTGVSALSPQPAAAQPSLVDAMRRSQPSPALAGASPVAPDGGDIVVTAPAAPAPTVADVWDLDEEMGGKLIDMMSKLGENERKDFAHKYGVGASVAMAASELPLEQRIAAIDAARPQLLQAGFSQQEIDAFDPSDANLRQLAAIGVGADKLMADKRSAEGQRITQRGQDISAATARRGQDMSAATARRGQDISAATAIRGQNMSAEARNQPKPAQVKMARQKLASLDALDAQIARAEAALKKSGLKGPWAGKIGGGWDPTADAADKSVAALAPLVRQLTRVPGEGAMSDYESRLAQAALPGRDMTEEGRQEAFESIKALSRAIRDGYGDMSPVAPAAAPDTSGFRVIRRNPGRK